MAKPLCYSYTRFSDPRQANGHSAERQADYASRWAKENGMTLDTTLSLKDEGLSAYHQMHVRKGALGVFLQAVDDGRIPRGSVLIVEGLDRLSRAEPIQAQAQLSQIINGGITVVTASDNKVYSRESLRAQPMDLVYSLLISIRAHEESETKSKRVTASIRRQCENWVAGSYRGIIRNGKDPAWLNWNGSAWELIPSRVEAVLEAIKLYKEGHGAIKIVRELAARGMAITDLGAQSQQIYRTVKLRALVGEKVIEVGGQEYRLQGYYPPIMSEADFAALRVEADGRVRRKGKGEIPGIVTGIRTTYCGYCGTSMNSLNAPSRRNKKGHLLMGHRRIICTGYSHNAGCTVGGSCSVVPIENAVMNFCSDQMNLSALVSGSNRKDPILSRIASIQQHVTEAERQVDKITSIMLGDGGVAPQALVKKMRDLEEQLAKDRTEIEAAQFELASLGSAPTQASSKAWKEARKAAQDLDYDARMKVRQLVANTFQRIVIYQRGVTPNEADPDHIELLLISKSGNTRLLKIHRFTGEWRAMEDYSAQAA